MWFIFAQEFGWINRLIKYHHFPHTHTQRGSHFWITIWTCEHFGMSHFRLGDYLYTPKHLSVAYQTHPLQQVRVRSFLGLLELSTPTGWFWNFAGHPPFFVRSESLVLNVPTDPRFIGRHVDLWFLISQRFADEPLLRSCSTVNLYILCREKHMEKP